MSKRSFKKGFYDNVDESVKKNVKLSILEGSLSTVMGTFIGGAFLIGFALTLGANDFEIGLLASLPLLANLIQIAGSYIITKVGSRKKVCITYLFLHRLIWTFIAVMPLIVFREHLTEVRVWIFLLLLTGAGICASITGIAWTSWVADLVPSGFRGRFFSRRNMVAQVVAMVMAVIAGRFIDTWKINHTSDHMQSYGFMILFCIGIIFGIAGVMLFRKINEPKPEITTTSSFFKQLKEPFKDKNFKLFMWFSVAWGFSTGLVGPFFSVYMIKTLMIPFSVITLFGVVAGLANIAGLKIWGSLIDKVGPKPLYLICGIGGSFVPFLWIFASPENYLVIWGSNILSGFCFSGIGLSATGMMMNLAPKKNNSIYFAVFAAVTGLFGAFAPIAGGALGEFLRGKVLYEGIISLSDIRLLFVTSTFLRLLSLSLINFISIPDNISVKDMLSSLTILQKYLPLYNIQSFASAGMNYIENASSAMTRGVINVERKIDTMVTKGVDLGKTLLFRIHTIDKQIDKKLTEHEDHINKIIDKILNIFKYKK